MRRFFLFVLSLILMCPAIGQEIIHRRNCRQVFPEAEMSRHATHRSSALKSTNRSNNKDRYKGKRRQLVVMVEFADWAFLGDSARTMEQWNKILNAKNFNEGPFCGSVHDYFYDQSYGQFDLTFDMYYMVAGNRENYHSTATSDVNAVYLVREVVKYLSERVEDWSVYDWDGDGFVDQLLMIFAGKGQSDGGDSMTIWPHQWWLSDFPDYFHFNPITVRSGNGSYIIDSYCFVQELSKKGDYGAFGTLCHEFSHCLGLPDFYYGSTSYVSNWDLMDYGNYNGNGFRPCSYSAFERSFLGWLTPIELTEEQDVTGVPALSSQPVAYMIRNEGRPDEFYVIENRQNVGWDESLPGSGILVFHVDYDEDLFIYGRPNTINEQNYLIIPANNKKSVSDDNIKGWAYPYGLNNSLTNTSTPAAELFNPNSDNTVLMSKPVTQMTVTEGIASFHFHNDMPTGVPYIQQQSLHKDDGWYRIDNRLYIHQGKVVWVR